MALSPALQSVVVVTGPTAAGKTELAIELCRRLGGEVVNADSMQVYRGMDIGTAKPTREQQGRARHHLLDVANPDDRYSAGRYAIEARAAARDIQERGRLVVVSGGTGLYIRAFLEGLLAGGEADAELREHLEAEHAAAVAGGDPGRLHRRLAESDAEAAARIHPNDARRIIRALEIRQRSGVIASRLRREHGFSDRPYRSLQLALDPGTEELDARIDARCRGMIDGGLLQEVRRLMEAGYGPELVSMQSIGYRHLVPVALGRDTLEGVLPSLQRDTRRFARRQRTWLRRVPEAQWVHPADTGDILKRVEAFLDEG